MSVSGPCEICQVGTVDDACDRCGKLVCERHFDEQTGFCVECVAEVGTGHDHPVPTRGTPQSDDVHVNRF
jgi:hypothetical protein